MSQHQPLEELYPMLMYDFKSGAFISPIEFANRANHEGTVVQHFSINGCDIFALVQGVQNYDSLEGIIKRLHPKLGEHHPEPSKVLYVANELGRMARERMQEATEPTSRMRWKETHFFCKGVTAALSWQLGKVPGSLLTLLNAIKTRLEI